MADQHHHDDLANAIRALSMDAVERAKSGHPGMPMGMADVATVLFTRHLKYDASKPEWPDRDRFVLSAGHGSMLLYALLYLTGHADMTIEELQRFRQLGARTAGHPEHGHASGIETTTGPLGQGIATAVGMAMAERLLAGQMGSDLVDHRTWVIASDGDLMEGISHEACSMAGHLGLSKLIVLFDDNQISIDGPTSLSCSDDTLLRFQAYGWDAQAVDGHDPAAIDAAILRAKAGDRPSLIACRTVIAKGAPKKAGTSASHGAPLGAEEIAGARAALGWPHEPFVVPEPIVSAWRAAGQRGAMAREAWTGLLASIEPERRAEFERRLKGHVPEAATAAVDAFRQKLLADRPSWATRKSSQEVLKVLTPVVPELLGGSADLTGSVFTNTPDTAPVKPGLAAGRHVHYGIREHAMVAAMNGMALHRGLIPYGGTFLVFSDYCRPAIRLAALMEQRVVMVFTHDSIGLGEDGPTHQPVEHLAALRAIPNLYVFRPADAIETAECWQAALGLVSSPSILALSRQELPVLRTSLEGGSLAARGAYVVAEADGERDVTILATGSEVAIAVAGREVLATRGVKAAVVSMPCWELFEEQDPAWRSSVLGTAPRIAVEAASAFGWTRYVEREADVVCLKGFGASGPIKQLYEHFGITAQAVADRAAARLGLDS